jgi:hypothetical protein
MSLKEITASPTYNPNRVLDAIIEKLQLKNDAALSRALEVAPPVISRSATTPANRRHHPDPYARDQRLQHSRTARNDGLVICRRQ